MVESQAMKMVIYRRKMLIAAAKMERLNQSSELNHKTEYDSSYIVAYDAKIMG